MNHIKIFTVLCAVTSLVIGFQGVSAADVTQTKLIPSLDAKDMELDDVIEKLWQENDISLAVCKEIIVPSDPTGMFPKVTVELKNKSLAETLNIIFLQVPLYGWSEDAENNIVNIFPKASNDPRSTIFNEVFGNLNFKNKNMLEVTEGAFDHLKQKYPAKYGNLKFEMAWPEAQKGTTEWNKLIGSLPKDNFEFNRITFRHLLNSMIHGRNASWTAFMSEGEKYRNGIGVMINKSVERPLTGGGNLPDHEQALAKIVDPELKKILASGDVKKLIGLAKHSDPAVRLIALSNILLESNEAFSSMKAAELIEPVFLDALSDNDQSVRMEALSSLRQIEEAFARKEQPTPEPKDSGVSSKLAEIKTALKLDRVLPFLQGTDVYLQSAAAVRVIDIIESTGQPLAMDDAKKLRDDIIQIFRHSKNASVKVKLLDLIQAVSESGSLASIHAPPN